MRKSGIGNIISIIVWTMITIVLAIYKEPVYLIVLAASVILFNIVALIINIKTNKK